MSIDIHGILLLIHLFSPQRAVEEQQFNLREGAEIIIATPGRLKDIIERHVLVLSQCRYIVMDEADRMVHLGFEVDLTYILDALPSETMQGEDLSMQMDVDGETMVKRGRTRVTTLFSATMPPAVERLARKYLKKPAIITIGEAGRAVDTVEQRVEFVSGDEKKKCVNKAQHHDGADCHLGKNYWKFSTVARSRRPLSFSSIKKKLPIWLQKICNAQAYVCLPLSIYHCSCPLVLVERGYSTFRKEPGAARGLLTITSLGRVRHSGGYRFGWSRY